MITISLRFDEKMKKELDDMCDEMGMNLTTFFMIYAKKVLRDRRIPFDIAASDNRSHYSSIPYRDSYNEEELYSDQGFEEELEEELYEESETRGSGPGKKRTGKMVAKNKTVATKKPTPSKKATSSRRTKNKDGT